MTEVVKIEDEGRTFLMANVDSLVFVDGNQTVNKYKCLNCGTVAIKHHITNCKHIFCSNCIKNLLDTPCPRCSTEITEVMKDAQIDKEMLELNVECQYKKRGCQKINPLHKYQEHDSSCQFSRNLQLPKLYDGNNKNGLLQEFEDDLQQAKAAIKEIQEDMKKEDITKNNFKISLGIINGKVDTINHEIKQLKVASQTTEDNGKVEFISKELENLKLISQEQEKIQITLKDFEKMIHQLQREMNLRKEFEQKNIEMMSDLISNISKTPKSGIKINMNSEEPVLEHQGRSKADPDEISCQGKLFYWKITDFKKRWQNLRIPPQSQDSKQRQPFPRFLKPSHQLIQSDHFHDIEFDFVFSVNFKYSKPNISVDLSWHRCNAIFAHARRFTLVDQSARAEKKHIKLIDIPLFNKKSTETMQQSYFRNCILAPISLIENEFTAYAKDDSLLLEICLMPLAPMYKSVVSHNGILMWRVDNYAKRKQEEINGIRQCLISDSFYTAPQGYRVHVCLYLNGEGHSKGEHISIYVDFIMGEHDMSLPGHFSGMARFFLRDQTETSNKQHVCKEIVFPHTEGGRYHGLRDFLLPREAEQVKYMKQDSLLFKIMVEII